VKVLIIEDEPDIAALVCDYLTVHGYETARAEGGMRGLSMALEGGYDLVILDIMLPGMSGFEVLRELRERSDVPVLILSAKSEEVDKVRGLGLGADDYIQKPFSPTELVARVGAHISRYKRLSAKNEPVRKRELLIRGLRIDLDARQVFLRGAEVMLTGKEFDVLAFLAGNPNKVYSKDKLFESVWGLDALGDAGTVVVHIKNLREKIEDDPQAPQYIETVWGAGYRLRV
jgi:DNA-binding response OmpR family regulator